VVKTNLFGFNVEVVFMVSDYQILAYAWHYTKEKAREHMEKIMEFHSLKGKVVESEDLENWLREKLKEVVISGKIFKLPQFNYKNRRVYEELIKIPKGKTITYSELAKLSRVKYQEVLITLMRNPFQILIPCHRLLTKKGSLMGFYPLGIDVKKKLLEIEGIKCDE